MPATKKMSARRGSAPTRKAASAPKKKAARPVAKSRAKVTAKTVRKKKSPFRRVRAVAVQVAHQAQSAVTEGVSALREMGEGLVERVGG